MHTTLRHFLLLISLWLVGCVVSYADNKPHEVDARVAPYLQRLNNAPRGPLMQQALDSLEIVAKRYKDEKALSMATTYHMIILLSKNDVSRKDIFQTLEHDVEYCQKTGNMTYAYNAITYAVEWLTSRRRYRDASACIAYLSSLGDDASNRDAYYYAYHGMGNMYKQLGLYKLALESFHRALSLCNEKMTPDCASNTSRGIAETYRLMHESPDSARHYTLYSLHNDQDVNHYEGLLQAQFTIPYTDENRSLMDSLRLISDSLERVNPNLRQRNMRTWLLAQSNIAFGDGDYQRVIDLHHQRKSSRRAPMNPYILMESYLRLGYPDSALMVVERMRQSYYNEEDAIYMINMEEERNQIMKEYELRRLNILHNQQALELLTLQQEATRLQQQNAENDRRLLDMQVSEEEARDALLRSLTQQEKDSLAHIQQLVQQYEAQTKQHKWAWAFIAMLMIAALLVSAIFFWRQYISKRREHRLAKLMQAEVYAATLAEAQALKSEALKSVFLQNMNHEIRAPLAAVVSFNELLNSNMRDSMSEEEQKNMADLVRHNSDLLITLIDDVINISDLQNNNYLIKLHTANAQHLCEQVAKSLKWRVPEGVELIVEEGEPLPINTDSARLQQVLFNLLTNACKYTQEGSITISCQPFDSEDGTPWVRFVVEDTGCGVPDDKVDRLFDRFEMLDTLKPGNGLGLNICYRISQLMKGRLYYDRTYRQGARFVFEQMRQLTLALMACLCLTTTAQDDQYDSELMMNRRQYNYMQKIASHRMQWSYYPMCDTLEQMGIEQKDTGAICAAYFMRSSFALYDRREDLMIENALRTMHLSVGKPWDVKGYSSLNGAINYLAANHEIQKAQMMCDTLEYYARREKENTSYYNLVALRARASVLESMGLYQMAATKLKRGLDELDKKAFPSSLSTAYHSLMSLYEKAGIPDSAYIFGLQAINQPSSNNNRMINYYELVTLYRRGLYPIDSLHAFHHRFDSLAHIVMSPEGRSRFYLADANYYIFTHQFERADSLLNASTVRPTRHWKLKCNYFREKQQWDSAFHYSLQEFSYIRRSREMAMQNMRHEAETQHEHLQMEAHAQELEASILKQKRMHIELDLLQQQHESEAAAKEQVLQRQRLAMVNEQNSQRDQERIALRLHTQWEYEQLKADEFLRSRAMKYNIVILTLLALVVAALILLAIRTSISRRKLRLMLVQLKQRRHEAMQAQHKAEEADLERTHFLQTISHEVRTPLNAIIGFTDILNNPEIGEISPDQREFMLERISYNTHYMNLLVENLLFLSKLESGTYRSTTSTCTVGEMVSAALRKNQKTCPKGVTMQTKGSPQAASVTLSTDTYALGYLLDVLLDNARKFTAQGSITLQYSNLTIDGKPWMEFAVADTGIGVLPEDVDKLFVKSFYKKDEFMEGVGMGLSIAHLLADVLHGTIHYDTTYTLGARFVLRIPVD